MTWVKVCGITDEPALEAAIEGGADAVGFVLFPGSPRFLALDRAASLMDGVPIATFIVTVDLTPAEAFVAAEYTGARGIQNHGLYATDVAAEAVDAGYLSLHPVRVGPEGPELDARDIPDQSMPLYDTASAHDHGGTGVVFDWNVLTEPGRPFVLAGGLGPDNVSEAIRTVRPFGVDASSKLETEPGVKDPASILAFIERAKLA
jgi:phosphoribosylanthranilate isomerase